MKLRDRIRERVPDAVRERVRQGAKTAQAKAPLLRTLGKVLLTAGLVQGVEPARIPDTLRVVAEQGLGIRSVHALQAALHPDRVAVFDEHHSLTYRQLDEALSAMADHLRLSGLRRRDVVVLAMENSVAYVVAWFGVLRAGLRVVHASWELAPPELEYVLTNSSAKAIVTSATSAAALAMVPEAISAPLKRYHEGEGQAKGAVAVEQFFRPSRSGAKRSSRTSDDVSNIVYTSGTTGKPKGAVRDLASLNLLELSAILERLPVRDGERHWIAARLYHSAPQAMLMMMTSLGGTVGIQRRFDPAQTLRALSKHGMTSIFLVPTMIARMVELPDSMWREHPVQLRLLLSGAAPFVHALRLRAIERFGVRAVHDFYGATELGWVTSLNGMEMLLRPDSVGRPLVGQSIRIELEDGSEAPVGTVGVLRVRNEQLMAGYLDNPGATAETLRDGWMTVEDNAWVDADGYIYLAGRARDMIISGGVNVYPAEVESALASCDGVDDVAVIGVPDPVWGERVEAFVVLRKGCELDRVQAEARVRLSGARRPRAWHVLDELPRNATGKVLKRVLRERVTEP